MKNYSTGLTNRTQKQPIFGRTDMVQNNAGGYGFEITPQERLERFLLIGSEGGTYYVGEQKLTQENAENILKLLKTNGAEVVATVVDFAVNRRAPKADAGIFVLALAASFGDQATKNAAYQAVTSVAQNSTQLFTFLANVQNLRGWSRGLRKAVARFYTGKSVEKLAYQIVKYRNRAGFTHRDALRLSHPQTTDAARNELLKYAVGKVTEAESTNTLVQTFGKAQTAKGAELVALIDSAKLTWEMVPTSELNDADVLKALLPNMQLTALVRNLNRFAKAGLTKGNSATTKAIVKQLTDKEFVGSNMHPVNVINSMLTYSSGRGVKGDSTWEVNQNIVDALQTTFELALKALVPTNKKILIGVDISGSMNAPVNGMQMNASQIANVLAVTILKSEPNAEMVWFDTNIVPAKLGRRSSIDEVLRNSPHGGGTDCAQPIIYAANELESFDAILILTDSETWAGPRHGFEVLQSYRKNVNRDVKVIEIALTATGHSTMPADDKNLLRVVGFDASVIDVVNAYLE
jgi:60 kDa SS-A/Ro ribonucleoprotein